jgi:hypothetical protein
MHPLRQIDQTGEKWRKLKIIKNFKQITALKLIKKSQNKSIKLVTNAHNLMRETDLLKCI